MTDTVNVPLEVIERVEAHCLRLENDGSHAVIHGTPSAPTGVRYYNYDLARDLRAMLAAAPKAEPAHDSDCALHNEPAYPNGLCDCAVKPVETLDEDDMKRARELRHSPDSEDNERFSSWFGDTLLDVHEAYVKLIAQPEAPKADCDTCEGRGIVGGFAGPESGYQDDPCPSCQPEAPKVEQEPVAWRPVVGFEDAYEVSSEGDIRNTKTGRIQSKNLMGQGYVKADLWKNGSRTQTSVHRVVAEAFLPRATGDTEVNHIDGDKKNNRVSNLEWSDRKRNTDHSRYVLGNDVKPVLAIDPTSGAEEYFPSIEQAGRSGYSASGIYDALNGRKKTHGGKKWTYTAWRQPTHPAPASDELLEALEEARTTISMLKRNVVNEINNHDGFSRWEGVPDALQARIDVINTTLARHKEAQT